MTYYTIRHLTRYRYSAAVRESVMEVRMQPHSDNYQRCHSFKLSVTPHAQVTSYEDYLGNIIHHFDIPGSHVQLSLTAEALVEVQPFPVGLPDALPLQAWSKLEDLTDQGDFWDMLQPSHFTQPTPLLNQLAEEFELTRRSDPLTLLHKLTRQLYQGFDYAPQTTRVDSPIDEALAARRGVCQDFTHIMLALVRPLGIPARYVSGYLSHRQDGQDRSAEDATHAWVEAYLPDLGWIGFDPTNNLVAGERHIRVAFGRDYGDVPPTRGVFTGQAEEQLSVGVRVAQAEAPPEPDEAILPDTPWSSPPLEEDLETHWQQQQQQ